MMLPISFSNSDILLIRCEFRFENLDKRREKEKKTVLSHQYIHLFYFFITLSIIFVYNKLQFLIEKIFTIVLAEMAHDSTVIE